MNMQSVAPAALAQPAPAPSSREWRGHLRSTRYVLEPLLLRCAEEENPRISLPERLLFNACEFWAAVANRCLIRHLGRAPHWRLAMATDAFEGCGAIRVARVLRRQASALPTKPSGETVEQTVAALEAALLPMSQEIDTALARFANRILDDSETSPQIGASSC